MNLWPLSNQYFTSLLQDDYRKLTYVQIIAEATTNAYKGASLDIQQKLRRVVDVWRQRQILNPECQKDIENRINDVDRQRGGARKGGLGGSLNASIASNAPPEYQALLTAQSALARLEPLSKPAADGAEIDWKKFNDPTVDAGSLAKQAGTLGGLLKTLANAEGAVAETLKSRKSLIEGLEKILTQNKEAEAAETEILRTINSRKVEVEGRKRKVEDDIMAGFAAIANASGGGTPDHSPPRPDAEPLTPPPITDVESITPTGTPIGFRSTTGADVISEQPPHPDGINGAPPFESLPASAVVLNGPGQVSATSAESNGPLPGLARHASPMESAGKRRKMSGVAGLGDEFAGFEDGLGVDPDVEALLG